MLLPTTCTCLSHANAYNVLLSTTHCRLTHAVVYSMVLSTMHSCPQCAVVYNTLSPNTCCLSSTHCHLSHAVVFNTLSPDTCCYLQYAVVYHTLCLQCAVVCNTLPSDTCWYLQYAVVYHMLLSMMCIMQVHSGRLPLSPGSTLAWLGFSDEALLATYDSEVMPAYSRPLIYSRGHITFVM